MYRVENSQLADKFLTKLDKHVEERIRERLNNLGNDPVPTDAKFITRKNGNKVFRYRIGDYRALYILKETEKIVLVAKIDKRPRVYSKK